MTYVSMKKAKDMHIESGRLKDWKEQKVRNLLFVGAVEVSKDQAMARIEVCMRCDHAKKVQPLPGMYLNGCGICGCPFATKPYFHSVQRALDRLGNPLTLDELVKMKIRGVEDTETEIITCPHPDGNKWGPIDETFK